MSFSTYLLLAQIIRQVSHHNLGLGSNAIFGRSTLLLGTGTGLAGGLSRLGGSGIGIVLVGEFSQRSSLARGSGGLLFSTLSTLGLPGTKMLVVAQLTRWDMTYRATSAGSTTNTAATTATATSTSSRPLAAFVAAGTFTATYSTLSLGLSGLRLAGKLNGNLALKNFLSGELFNSASGFRSGCEVHERIADGAVVAGVHRDRDALTKNRSTLVHAHK